MALVDEEQFIPLGGPLDSQTDEKVIQVGAVPTLKNAIPLKKGEYGKRLGSEKLPTGLTPGAASLGPTWQLAPFGAALVDLQQAPTKTPIAVYSPVANGWSGVGSSGTTAITSGLRGPVSVSRSPLASDVATNIPGDIAASNLYLFVAHTDASSAMHFYALDQATNKIVYRWKVLGNAIQPRIIIVNGYVSLFYFDGTNRIKADVWQISALDAGTGVPTTYNITTTDALGIFDAIAVPLTAIAVAYRQSANKTWRVDFTPSTGATSSVEIKTAAAASIDSAQAICWLSDFGGSGKFAVATAGPVGSDILVQWNLTAGTPAATYDLFGPAGIVAHITGHTISSAATGEFHVLCEQVNVADNRVIVAERTVASGINVVIWLRTMALSSRTFSMGGGFYVLVTNTYDDAEQKSYFLMQVELDIVSQPNVAPQARLAVWEAVAASASSNLPSGALVNSAVVIPIATTRQEISSIATAIELATFEANPVLGSAKQALGGLLLPGGMPSLFDGISLTTYALSLFPKTPLLTQGTGGGLTLLATYWYQVVFSRVNANGQAERSAPSVPVSIVLTGSNNKVTLVVNNLLWTDQKVKTEIYRTLANTTEPFQLVAVIDNDTVNVTTNVVDTMTDLAAAAGAFIYTTGDVLENQPTPGFSSVAVFDNRIWGVSMDNSDELWFSQEVEPGIVPGFNEANIKTISDSHGPITALASAEGRLAIFKRDMIYGLPEGGPDAQGRGGYPQPQIVATGPGTANPQSVVACKEGVFFESPQDKSRICLLDRGFSVQYIGGPVQAYTDPIVASVFLPTKGEVRIFLASTICLTYDLVYSIWRVDDYALDPNAFPSGFIHACTYGDITALAPHASSPEVWVDSLISYQDGVRFGVGTDYAVTIESPPLSLNGLEGFQRLRKLLGVGEALSDHALVVTLLRDFNNASPAGTFTGNIVAATQPQWDWELRPKIDQLSACKVRIAFTCLGAGAKVTGFTVIYARKPGGRRGATSKILKST